MQAQELQAGIAVPEGFEKILYRAEAGWGPGKETAPGIRLQNKDVRIRIEYYRDDPQDSKEYGAGGHTEFETVKGWMTFDRTGVEDSFYVTGTSTIESVNEDIQKQLKRVAEARERAKVSVTVPVLGFNLSPETYALYKQRLAAGLSVQLTPAGFGIGYHLSTKRGNGSRAADTKLLQFFNVSRLYLTEMDCD